MRLFFGHDNPTDDAVRPVGSNDHLGAVRAVIGLDCHPGPVNCGAFHICILEDEETTLARFVCQPGVELVSADGTEGEFTFFLDAHRHALAVVVEMSPIHIIVGDFGNIQPQFFQNHFAIGQEAAAAQFRARVMGFFQDERAWNKFRCDLRQMQRCGYSRRTGAHDDDIVIEGSGMIFDGHPPIVCDLQKRDKHCQHFLNLG